MDKKYKKLEIAGFFIISALAVLFHFLYELLPSPIIAAIAPVNESIWEHIKIIYFPYLIWSIIEYFILKPEDKKAFKTAKSYALALMPIILIAFNYTYSGIIGKHITAIDVGSTFVYLLIAFLISYNGYKKRWSKLSNTACLLSMVFCFALIIFTFSPPRLELFKDSTTGSYGIISKQS